MASPPVTFPCPFCTRRMGVPAELLGRQVRCPHCKQVVVAPVTAGTTTGPNGVSKPPQPVPPPTVVVPTPAPEPELRAFNIPQKKEGADSILSEPDESDDEVFGSQPGPRLPALPRDQLPPPLPEPESQPATVSDNPFGFGSTPTAPTGNYTQPLLTATIFDLPPNVLPSPVAPTEASNPFGEMDAPAPTPTIPQPVLLPLPQPVPQAAQPQPVPVPALAGTPTPIAPASGNPFEDFEEAPTPLPGLLPTPVKPSRPAPTSSPEELPDEAPRKQPRNEDDEKPAYTGRSRPAAAPSGGGAKNVVLFLLAGYALVATGLAVYGLFFKPGGTSDPHPLSTIPDNFGEFPAVNRKKVSKINFPVDGELPAAQRARLGGKIVIGQLEVQPIQVQKRRLQLDLEGTNEKDKQSVRTAAPALVLTLAIKNTSPDLPIYPMDPAFTRRATGDDPPITRLVVGNRTFLGGEIEWPLPTRFKKKIERQQGNDGKPLAPTTSPDYNPNGHEYIVFTEASADLVKTAEASKEPLQWRVQVRRGLIDYKGKEVPVTAVIGVDFLASDILPPE